jgi:hypothetical protein
MSLFAILYSADDLTPEEVVRKLFPEGVPPPELTARATVLKRKNYVFEEFGVSARVQVYLSLDKSRSADATRALGAAARTFLGMTSGDMVLVYHDTPVIRRTSTTREYVRAYREFEVPSFVPVDTIHLPRDAASR